MPEYFILHDPTGRLDIDICSRAVDSITKLLRFGGLCMYLPVPKEKQGTVILFIDKGTATESETEWFIRTLAGRLSVSVLIPEGGDYFAQTEDNDPSFFDMLPAPENECRMIRLFFYIDGFTTGENDDVLDRVTAFFEKNEYEISVESDGFAAYICTNSFLDVFYRPGDGRITGEIDLSVSGAGVYAEVVELAEALAAHMGASVNFYEDEGFTYTTDKDFDKLRRSFYLPIAQQLAFAAFDDRDGLQGYIGWGTDTFEPEYVRGTVVTPFGRYDLERLKEEISKYGFSYVCDTRFLSRNTPSDGSEFYIKEALNLAWNTSLGGRDGNFNAVDKLAISQCRHDLEFANEIDPTAPFPKEFYSRICRLDNKKERDVSAAPDMVLHYEPGYLRGVVCYGFGHYLRKFKAPGSWAKEECSHGDDVFFFCGGENAFKIDCEINYGYEGDGNESPLGSNFAKGDRSDIEIYDIGGSSVVRFLEGEMIGNKYVAEAEIYIADELYRFAAASRSHDDIDTFREILRGCVSVEDWYDEVIKEEFSDPHANGGSFCSSGTYAECRAFMKPFPPDPGCLLSDATSAYEMLDEATRTASGGAMSIEDVISAITGHINNLKLDDPADSPEDDLDGEKKE